MAWSDILGQDLAKRLLRTHLDSGRVASAYLLVGPEGIGKRRLALEMAKALNCSGSTRLPALSAVPSGTGQAGAPRSSKEEAIAAPACHPSDTEAGRQAGPCDACQPCATIQRGVHPDVHLLAPAGAAQRIGIDDIRRVLERVALRPYSALRQVVIVDGAERLTEEAGNSLLKSLEEPTATTQFVLTTAHLPHCLPTLVSRCQMVRCQPLPEAAIERIVAAAAPRASGVASTVARLSGGSAARALELADTWMAQEAILARLGGTRPSAWLEQPLPDSRDGVVHLLDRMIGWLRDLAVLTAGASHGGVRLRYAAHEAPLTHQAQTADVDRCLDAAFDLMALRDSLEQFVSPRLVASLAREKWLSLTEAKHV